VVEAERCNGCGLCLRVGCPAISSDRASGKAAIDPVTCTGCAVCLQVCNFGAIAGEA
jgi:indolepyruvate ferredoxin oxidoreductase alpha subunit